MAELTAGAFDWKCRKTWKESAHNTMWCLIGCAIGDFGTIYYFQHYQIEAPLLLIMGLAMFNGIVTSILLETALLCRSMTLALAFRTAIGMSLISMISMELAMNLTDLLLVGSLQLRWWSVPWALLAGFLTPWPYNYWRLKAFGKACH